MSTNMYDGMTVEQVISSVYEYKELSDFLEDDRVDRCMGLMAQTYGSQGNIPPLKVAMLIVELQNLSSHCATKAIFYQTIGKGEPDAAHKKNIYYAMRDATSKLSDSMKYLMK